MNERHNYVDRHNKCAAEFGLIVQLKSWKQTNARAKKNIHLLVSSYIEIARKKICSHFHEFGIGVRLSAQAELSNKGTGIIKLDSVVQNRTIFIQEPSFKTKKSLTNSFLERKSEYVPMVKIEKSFVYRS